MKRTLTLLTALLLTSLHAADAPKLEPILSKRGDVIFSDSFDGPMKQEWQPSMKTRFAIADGTLNGQPATVEDQAKAHDEKHDGKSPAIQLNVPTTDCIVHYAFKFSDKITAQHLVFNDGTSTTGTGHISSLQLHFRTGASLSKKKNTKKQGDADEVLTSNEWKPEPGQWYRVMQEMRGDEVVVQIEGGPTLIAKHPRFATAKTWPSLTTWGGGGTVSYDDVQICKAEPNPQWETTRAKLMTSSKK
jgi:hypothetical protein